MSSVSNLDQLKQMFPNHEATYLEGVLLESDSVHDAISKILSAQDDAGIDTVFKLYCNVSSVYHMKSYLGSWLICCLKKLCFSVFYSFSILFKAAFDTYYLVNDKK